MDQKISKYFCIFCENCTEFTTIEESYNHYKRHMKDVFYCIDCDNNRKCNQNHSDLNCTKVGSESEDGLIEIWIERFLSYQNELVEKSFCDLFRSCKLFTGCAVCRSLLKMCTNLDIKYSKGDIFWSNNQSFANETRHVCSHLRYYPFECSKCEKAGRYHKKCDMSEITRHIKSTHSLTVKDSNFEDLIKSVKITKLESFIEYNFANRDPSLLLQKDMAPDRALVVPPMVTRNLRRSSAQLPKPVVVLSEPKPKKPRLEAKVVVTNTDRSDNQNNVNSNQMIKTYDKNGINNSNEKSSIILSLKRPKNSKNYSINMNEKKVINNYTKSVAKVKIKFKPIVKTISNQTVINKTSKPNQNNLISGDQIIIKKGPEVSTKAVSLINKSTPNVLTQAINQKVQKLSLSQHFSDFMDDEEGDTLQIDSTSTRVESKNVDYFCIFCTEKQTNKESTYRHIQRHLDYYPIVCLTCGEGLTDLQSFIGHHKERHREAVKGRYKKKEQPIVDKWISAFLYSQNEFIRSFPPRETCPVCDRVFPRTDVMSNKPRRCTINRKIDHLYRHLSYLPYECILCQQSGQEFFVAYFESKAHSHIKLKHPEIDDNDSRWHIFQKTVSIPKLDEFIENYLTEFGISLQFERRPVKKSNKMCSPIEPISQNNSLELNKSSLNLNMIFSDIIDSSDSPQIDSKVVSNPKTQINGNDKRDIDLTVSDHNMDLALLEEYNTNSNDTNIVVDVSPLTLCFDKTSLGQIEEELYFCVFCPQMEYFTKIEAYSHYGSHLEYLPVLCKICSNNFADVDHLMTHHQSVHSNQINVDYEICEDQILVKWVNEFLESQLSAKKVMPCSCSYNCPVCLKLFGNKLPDGLTPCAQHNDVLFSVHIHKHLNYFPYECHTCKRNGQSVRVPNLDSIAMTHLKEHRIENASMSQVVKNFPKTLVIPQLEKLIGDSVHRKRNSEKKNRLDLNPFTASQQTVSNNNSLHSNSSATLSGDPSTSNASLIKTQHIRLEGGRVVNLPPKALLQDSPKTITNGANGSAIEETNGSTVKSVNNICCVNCRQYFPNKKLFKLHHNQSHPGKPILCSKNI